MDGHVPPGADAAHYTQEQLSEKTVWSVAPPEDRLIVHEDHVYRALSVAPPSNDDGHGQWRWTLRPVHHVGEDHHFEADRPRFWRILPAHHAICAECGEPVPCRRLREQWAAAHAARRARDLMAIPEGVCWSCREPISTRQKSVTFPGENLMAFVGPPAAFHTGILDCRIAALRYQDEWLKADTTRVPVLAEHDPYSGTPNATQRRILAMAARGELRCHLTRVQVAGPDDDLEQMMTAAPDSGQGEYRWYANRLDRGADKHLWPLLAADLITTPAEPDPALLRSGRLSAAELRKHRSSAYRLTEAGWRTHRRYPPKAA